MRNLAEGLPDGTAPVCSTCAVFVCPRGILVNACDSQHMSIQMWRGTMATASALETLSELGQPDNDRYS